MNGKGVYSVVEAIPRYLLAVVACVSFAQFLLLLGVGTGRAAELGGATLARAILCGAIAGWWFYRAKKRKLIETAVAAHRHRLLAEPAKTESPSIEPVERGPCASDRASRAADGKLDSNDPLAVMYEAMGGEHAEQTAAPSEIQTASPPASSTDAASVAWTVGPIALLVFVVVVIFIVLAEQRPAPSTPAPAQDHPWESLGRPVGAPSPAPSESTTNKAVDCFDRKTGNKIPDPFGGFGGHAIKCAPGEIEKPATETPAPSESTTNKAGVSPRSFANSDTAPPVATLRGTETVSSCPDTIPAGIQAIPFSPEELKQVVGTEATIREIGSFDRSPDDRIYNRVPWEAHLHFSNGTNHCVSSAEVEVTLQHGSSSFREQNSAPQTQVVYDAVLRNGFSIRHDHQEKLQGITRLYLSANPSSGFVDVPTEEIVSVERREIHRVFFHPILRPGNTHFETIILSRRTNEGAEPLAIEYWRVTKVWGFESVA